MEGILGQDRALEVLQSGLRNDRTHHAMIFHGQPGVGKFTTAMALARVLLCHEPVTDLAGRVTACDGCPSCRLIPLAGQVSSHKDADDDEPAALRSAHPDLHVVTKELARYSSDSQIRGRKLMTIPVKVIEEFLISPVYLQPQLRHGKVVIVDEAELLAADAQNKLLKTLEEPPAGTHLILVTSSEDKLLITIRSRCQRVAFVPLDDATLTREIARRLPDLSPERQAWLVRFASGSLGRALLAVDYDLLDWADTVLPALDAMAHGQLTCGLGVRMQQMIDGFAKAWVDDHDDASKESANRAAAGLMWSMIAQHARRRIADAAAGPRVVGAEPAQAQRALEPWLGVIEALSLVESEMAANLNMGMVTDHAVSLMYRCLKPTPGTHTPSSPAAAAPSR
jgi:DNA polymerase III subunit delta'